MVSCPNISGSFDIYSKYENTFQLLNDSIQESKAILPRYLQGFNKRGCFGCENFPFLTAIITYFNEYNDGWEKYMMVLIMRVMKRF